MTGLSHYTNQVAFLLLSLTELVLLVINISNSYMARNIRSHNGYNNFIYFRTSGIYALLLRMTVPRKVPIAKIWGLTALNTCFMNQLGLKVVIIGKLTYAVKMKNIPVYLLCKETYTNILKSIHCVMSLARYSYKLTVNKNITLEVGLMLSQSYGYHHYTCNIYSKLVFIKHHWLHILVRLWDSIANIKHMIVLKNWTHESKEILTIF